MYGCGVRPNHRNTTYSTESYCELWDVVSQCNKYYQQHTYEISLIYLPRFVVCVYKFSLSSTSGQIFCIRRSSTVVGMMYVDVETHKYEYIHTMHSFILTTTNQKCVRSTKERTMDMHTHSLTHQMTDMAMLHSMMQKFICTNQTASTHPVQWAHERVLDHRLHR